MEKNLVLGIDIGGSGIKGTIVDITNGVMIYERHRIPTPPNATPEQICEVVAQIQKHFNWKGIIGCGFPAIVKNGVALSAANINKKNINVNFNSLIESYTGCKTFVFNDADAAGFAEINYSYANKKNGVIIFLTIGTGIGSAIFVDGRLMENTELGHIYLKNGKEAEKYTSDKTRKNQKLTWEQWGGRFNNFLKYLEFLFNPNLFIIGGGASKKFDKFSHKIKIDTSVVPATLKNNAGMIGAALLAYNAANGL